MKMTFEQDITLQKAINKWGEELQIDMCIEECSELIQALCKYKRGRKTNVTEELADVFIMIKQMQKIFYVVEGIPVQDQIDFKVNRLKERIES